LYTNVSHLDLQGLRLKKMATVENCSLADRMDRVYEKD